MSICTVNTSEIVFVCKIVSMLKGDRTDTMLKTQDICYGKIKNMNKTLYIETMLACPNFRHNISCKIGNLNWNMIIKISQCQIITNNHI